MELNRDELPQEKWKRERFEGQYIPNYEMSKGSKTYEKLHGIRSGMESLPITLGSNLAANIANAGVSLGGAFGKALTPHYQDINIKYEFPDTYYADDPEVYKWLDTLNHWTPEDYYIDTEDMSMHLTDKGKIQAIKENMVNDFKDLPSNTKKNFKNNKQSFKDLGDSSVPKGKEKITVSGGKQYSIKHPMISKVFKKALGVANVAGNAATSAAAGSIYNKLEDNWYEPSAIKAYEKLKRYLDPEIILSIEGGEDEYGTKYKAEGLNPTTWYKYIHPEIELIDEPMYKTDYSNGEIVGAYNQGKYLDGLPEAPEFWKFWDDKAKLEYIQSWKNLKKKVRRNSFINDKKVDLFHEED